MTFYGPDIESITFPTPSGCDTCFSTDASQSGVNLLQNFLLYKIYVIKELNSKYNLRFVNPYLGLDFNLLLLVHIYNTNVCNQKSNKIYLSRVLLIKHSTPTHSPYFDFIFGK